VATLPNPNEPIDELPGDDEVAPETVEEGTEPGEDGAESTVAVEIPAEPAENAAPPAENNKPVYRRNRVPAKVRIPQLVNDVKNAARERDLARQEVALRDQRIQDLEAKVAASTQRAQQTDTQAMQQYEARWRAEEGYAKQEVERAYAAGDGKAVAEAQVRLARATTAVTNLEEWKASIQPAPQPQAQPNAPQPQQPQGQPQGGQQQPMPPMLENFLAEHPYLDARSPDFDREMYDYATVQEHVVAQRLRRSGREPTPAEVLSGLADSVYQEFADRFDGAQPQPRSRGPIPMTTRQGAGPAPVSRTAPQQVAQQRTTRLDMTGEQRQFAVQMARNGAIKYPSGHPKFGQRMSDADAIVEYGKQIMADRETQAARRG
jgi:hypothetical protein